MDQAERIATALGGAKKTTTGWLCVCPCHEDSPSSPSLGISILDNKLLANCFAGCEYTNIKQALLDKGLIKLKSKSSPEQSNKTTKPRIHVYRDEHGNALFEKIKHPNGKWVSRIRNADGTFTHSVKSIGVKPLYNMDKIASVIREGGAKMTPRIIEGIDINSSIFLTEGEKDADILMHHGLLATTTASSSLWDPSYSEILKHFYVYVVQDNDAPGVKIARKRSDHLRSAGVKFKHCVLPEVFNGQNIKDVHDLLSARCCLEQFISICYEKFVDSLDAGPVAPAPDADANTDTAPETPRREHYYNIFRSYFGGTGGSELRRCIFTDDMVYQDVNTGLFVPAINKLRPLRSHIREIARATGTRYKASEVEDHLCALEDSLKPELVIKVPKWDNQDRIAALAARITLSREIPPDSGIDRRCLSELLKYWHAKMWARLYDPTVRNEIFILSGPQNIGKDYWIRENLGALGQYLVNFAIHNNERDTKEQLHRGLVMNISEFDRTSRSEVSLLKEIVTATQTDLRFAYDRRSATRPCRCSFIASTNVNDIFNDPTGHSRYVYFEVEDIDRSIKFSQDDQLQVLAQGQWLMEQCFKPDEMALKAMQFQIEDNTPDNEYDIIIERWDYLAGQFYYSLGHVDRDRYGNVKDDGSGSFNGFLPNNLVNDIIVKISRDFDKSVKKIRSVLKMQRRQRVHSDYGRGYYFKFNVQGFDNQNYEI